MWPSNPVFFSCFSGVGVFLIYKSFIWAAFTSVSLLMMIIVPDVFHCGSVLVVFYLYLLELCFFAFLYSYKFATTFSSSFRYFDTFFCISSASYYLFCGWFLCWNRGDNLSSVISAPGALYLQGNLPLA